MNNPQIDFRYPEKYLSLKSENINQISLSKATELGEFYRLQKKILSDAIKEKKVLAKNFLHVKNSESDKKLHIEKTNLVEEKIISAKAELKAVEQKILEFVESGKEKVVIYPPQFSPLKPATTEVDPQLVISELCPDEQADWDEYVNSHPNGSIYHSLQIKNVIQNTFHHDFYYIMARDINGKISGILPLVHLKSKFFGELYSSVPFFNYGGILADNNKIRNQLSNYAEKNLAYSNAEFIEYRDCYPYPEMPCRKDKVSMVLDLPDDELVLWNSLGSKLRAQIKKGQEYEHHVRIGKLELVDDFYHVFARNMRDLGTPVYSKELFINMLKTIDKSNIIVLYFDNNPVATGFLLGWKNTLEIPWASTIREANQFNCNMTMYWNILKFAIKEKYNFFDFGRSSKNGPTYKFKKQWGAKEYQLYWHYSLLKINELPKITTNNPKFKIAILIWKNLPVWITKIIGPFIVKYIP